ncbi:activating signal cointegrator 1 complex subunit 1 isoform X2 [Panicum miliaceum]|uniref:Activating signal cointegrator 1 complex subunit 1 isoform X2 n=1 Tax=Panicum miliaceum TaxID=4540 RepID=A0A3L6SRL3_PANMI|nr:activating signal cointegrator 1 complex subunit 1 isoform X2 [Panicum miliaceum]
MEANLNRSSSPESVCDTLVPFLNCLIMPHDAADVNEISNSGSRQVIEDCITSSENLASDGDTNVVIEVTTNDASLSKNNLSLESSSTKVVIEDSVEVSGFNKDLDGSNVSGTYSSSIEVDVPLMRFVKGKGWSMQKKIEEDTGVKIIFPSSREETSVVLEGTSSESIRKASQMIADVLEEAVQSQMLDYSHFISLPLAIHPDLVDKLNYFQSSILGASASNEESDKDESRSEGSIDEMDHDHKQADGSSVSINLQVQEESAELWNKDRIAKASDVLQSVSSQVNEALENRPISIQLRGLVSLLWICNKKRNRWNNSFDARDIFRKHGKEEWGEYHIPEVHLSQRFKFDESGYYHCCSSIPLPAEMQAE